ncbi:hypothetical protein OAJ21_01170 [Pelagibacteraceae bacterium]|nr:hypothetical protein [Pelagibacteraceae bacterium]
MENIVIIGSGFSALTTYLKFKKYNPIIITSTYNKLPNIKVSKRKNLKTNKFFSSKSISQGNFIFNLKKNTNLHDRVSLGGNTNVWGGFININSILENAIKKFNNIGINFDKLDQNINGYLANNRDIRQLRDSNNRILDTSNFLTNYIDGFVNSIEFKNNLIRINYCSSKNKKTEHLIASKLFLGISFPQLIDLLYRSNLLEENVQLRLNEYNHKFLFNTNKTISENSNNNLIIKYDLIRSLKHFFGLQQSFDKYKINIPIYIDQIFSNNKIFLDLDINFKNKIINQTSNQKFGSSIHYCNLYINDKKISEYLNFFSNNIFGVSTSFINQDKPGPISNDIINNIWNRF